MRLRKNIGGLDRVIRLALGALLVSAGLFPQELVADAVAANVLVSIGVVSLLTGLMAYCPLYHLVGFNTRVNRYPVSGKSS